MLQIFQQSPNILIIYIILYSWVSQNSLIVSDVPNMTLFEKHLSILLSKTASW